jgi:hypothetical protein
MTIVLLPSRLQVFVKWLSTLYLPIRTILSIYSIPQPAHLPSTAYLQPCCPGLIGSHKFLQFIRFFICPSISGLAVSPHIRSLDSTIFRQLKRHGFISLSFIPPSSASLVIPTNLPALSSNWQ